MAEFANQLQRVINLCTTEATEYERAQRLGLLQPALDALTQSATGQQHAHFGTQRANVLLRPLAANQTGEDAAQATAAMADAANAAALQPGPVTAGVLPNPLLMTPAGAALLQTPGGNAAAWAALRGPADASAALGLTPAVALAGAGVRPVGAYPHFLAGMMGTPMMQPAGRPGSQNQQQVIETDDGKTSKKRQGYHIEPAALQKLIEKQQLEAQRKQQQEQQQQAAAAAAAAAGSSAAASHAAAGGSADEPPPRQAQQQHRPRVMSRLPPQVREQAERQAAERARKQQEEDDEDEDADADHGSGSSRQHSTVGGGSSAAAAQPVTAADCLESPNGAGLGGLGLPVGPELDPQGQGIELDLEAGKLFGSAQKRLRLSLCDEHGALLPGGQTLISPVVLPTPSPAIAGSGPVPTLAGGGSAAAGGSSTAAGAPSQEAPTPSKFFTGSPVPQTERRALGEHRAPETPVALVAGPQPARQQDVQQALGTAVKAQAGGSSSSWVPVPGQAPAVLGATPVPAPPAASGAMDMDDLSMDPAAAAAMPVPESPLKQVVAVGGVKQGSGAGGSAGGSGDGGMVLQTPDGQEQAVSATPVSGL